MPKFTLKELEIMKSGIEVMEFESILPISDKEAKRLIEKLDLAIAEREHVEEPE
jgi:hypothetical protein